MRLELNKSTDLALRAMRALCAYGDRFAGAALARTLETSHYYLPQIMAPLVHRGWVTSTPGPSGGYELVAKVGSISVLELIEAMEGPDRHRDGCVERGSLRHRRSVRTARSVVEGARGSAPRTRFDQPRRCMGSMLTARDSTGCRTRPSGPSSTTSSGSGRGCRRPRTHRAQARGSHC